MNSWKEMVSFSSFRSEKRDKVAVFSVSLVFSVSNLVRLEPEVIVSRFQTVIIFRVHPRNVQTMQRSDVSFMQKPRNDNRRNVVYKKTERPLYKQSTKSTIQHKAP